MLRGPLQILQGGHGSLGSVLQASLPAWQRQVQENSGVAWSCLCSVVLFRCHLVYKCACCGLFFFPGWQLLATCSAWGQLSKPSQCSWQYRSSSVGRRSFLSGTMTAGQAACIFQPSICSYGGVSLTSAGSFQHTRMHWNIVIVFKTPSSLDKI